MNLELAAMYGTPGAPTQEDLEKTAQAELFAKLAADNGIDLNQLTDEQIGQLWGETFTKTADPDPDPDPDDKEKKEEEEKKEKAEKEHEEKKAAQEKIAEADYLGRVMAHSYVNELTKIGEAQKTADPDPGRISAAARAAASKIRGLGSRVGQGAASAAKKVTETGRAAGAKSVETVKKHPGAFGAAAGAAGGAGAGYAAGRRKHGSAIDELAAGKAVEKAAEAGIDPQEAAEKVSAVFTLGAIGESEKIAMTENVDQAVDVRALEILEAAGYPVTWE